MGDTNRCDCELYMTDCDRAAKMWSRALNHVKRDNGSGQSGAEYWFGLYLSHKAQVWSSVKLATDRGIK